MTTQALDRRTNILTWAIGLIGAIMLVAGVATWFVVQDQLTAENITVADDADMFAGDDVKGPFTAYAQAEVIAKHAKEIGGGKTYAELPQDDPNRETVMTASFLRASLFTSVLAFGVAFMAAGLGLTLILIAFALRSVGHRPREAVVASDAGGATST